QVIGVLLIFAMMVTPAAIAVRLTRRPLTAVVVSVSVALFASWAGLFISWYEPYPVSFFIVTIAFAIYVAVRTSQAISTRLVRRVGRPFGPAVGVGPEPVRDDLPDAATR